MTPASPSTAIRPSRATLWTNRVRRLFSFPIMCLFFLGATILSYAPRGLSVGEPDIWWRLRNGSYLWQHHSLLHVDTYSFTAAGSPWTSFEWLSDLVFFSTFHIAGLQGIVAVYSLAMILIFAGVYYRCCLAGANYKDAVVATLGGICLGAVSLAPRPVLFGWIFLTAVLIALDHFRISGKGLWVLPPLFFVWINVHGSWIYGMVILVLTIAGGLIEGAWGLVVANRWSPAELRKLLLVLTVSIVALFVNPLGYKLVLYPFKFQLRLRPVMEFIEYWRPVDFSTWNGKLALGLIFAVLAAALFSRRRWRLDEVLIAAFALWSGLVHVRFLDLAAIIIVPILAPRLRLFTPYEPELDKPLLNAVIMLAVVVYVIHSFPSAAQLQMRVESEYPGGVLHFMQTHDMNGRIFHPAEFGGYLEWQAPQVKSFIDGRDEIFVANGTFADYISALQVKRPLEVLDKYKIDYVILEPYQPMAYVLQHSSTWHSVYSDNSAVLFERVSH